MVNQLILKIQFRIAAEFEVDGHDSENCISDN